MSDDRKALIERLTNTIVRNAAESDSANPENPDCICIDVNDLILIVRERLEEELARSAQPSPDAAQGGEQGEVAPYGYLLETYMDDGRLSDSHFWSAKPQFQLMPFQRLSPVWKRPTPSGSLSDDEIAHIWNFCEEPEHVERLREFARAIEARTVYRPHPSQAGAEAVSSVQDEVAIAWKIPATDGLPKKPGKRAYEQVDCLVVHKGERKHLVWNCEHEVWDDSSGDDFYCEPLDVVAYIEFDALPAIPQSALSRLASKDPKNA